MPLLPFSQLIFRAKAPPLERFAANGVNRAAQEELPK
jgi:hypothetical protein